MAKGTTRGEAKRGEAPTISLVLPVFNGEAYLAQALESIFAQTCKDFELIAVDDCSTDRSPRILAEYASRHPQMRVLRNPQNAKLPASLNAGFRAARGRWFSWTSDDNLLEPGMLARLYDAARTESADIVYSDFHLIDADGNPIERVRAGQPQDLVIGNPIGCSFLYRSAVDERLGGYDERLFGVEDYDFWLRAYRAGLRFEVIHEPLYRYRRHGRSLTATRAKQIHALSSPLKQAAIEELPPSPSRAQAYIRLVTDDVYHFRWNLLARALRDDPPTLLRHLGPIFAWLRFSVRKRLSRHS